MADKNSEIASAFEKGEELNSENEIRLNRYGFLFDDLVARGDNLSLEGLEFDDLESYKYRKELLKLIPSKALLADSKSNKKSLLINLTRVTESLNGTAKYAISLANQFILEYGSRFRISVLISKASLKSHKSSLKLSGVEVLHQENEEAWLDQAFDISFSISQFMEIEDLAMMARHSKRISFLLLDYIGIKATYIDRMISMRGGYSPFKLNLLALQFADSIASISYTSLEDIKSYTKSLVPNVRFSDQPIQLAVPNIKDGGSNGAEPEDPASAKIKQFLKENPDFIFIMGNGFHHKAVLECAEQIAKTKLKFIQMHSELQDLPGGSLSIPSGRVEEGILKLIYGQATIIAFPSVYEGLGLPVLEAVQADKVVIAVDNDLNRELIREYKLDPKQVILFKKFSQLPSAVEDALDTAQKVRGLKLKFKIPRGLADWARPVEQSLSLIQSTLAQDVDLNLVYRRALVLNLLEDQFKVSASRQAEIANLSLEVARLTGENESLRGVSIKDLITRKIRSKLKG